MLQLPSSKPPSGAIKRGLLKGLPNVKPYNCPVLALMAKYEQTLDEYDKISRPAFYNQKILDRLCARMDQIADRASRLIPTSFEGASFQIMLASGQQDMIVHGSTEQLRREASERMVRLLRSALKRLDVNGGADLFPLTRSCFVVEPR